MGMYNELNNISRSITDNRKEAERLQKSIENRKNSKIIIQNALLSAILGELDNKKNIYDDNVISYIIDKTITESEVENSDIIAEYTKSIYYTTASKAERIHKREIPEDQKKKTEAEILKNEILKEKLKNQQLKNEQLQNKIKQKTYVKKSTHRKNITNYNWLWLLLLVPVFPIAFIIIAALNNKK